MSVQFATIPLAHNYPDLPGLVRQIEDWGFAMVGVPDAHWLWPDCYVTLTQCALNSRRLRLGTFVTNPLTRHPAVTAGAIASINELSDGRAFLVSGRVTVPCITWVSRPPDSPSSAKRWKRSKDFIPAKPVSRAKPFARSG